jgi:hypothetical protein
MSLAALHIGASLRVFIEKYLVPGGNRLKPDDAFEEAYAALKWNKAPLKAGPCTRRLNFRLIVSRLRTLKPWNNPSVSHKRWPR